MSGAPLFSGPLAPNQPAAAPAAAAPGVAAPQAAAPASVGAPMFSGPLASVQPQEAAPAAPGAGPPVDTNLDQATSQGMAGVNEGIAGMLSSPNDLIKTIFNIGPEISRAMGGNTPNIAALDALPDAGKAYTQLVNSVGATRDPTNNPIDAIMRGAGQGVGGALIPEVGMEAAATKGAVKIGDILKGLIPAATSGASGSVAEQVAPGNEPARLGAEMMGAILPGGAKAALSGMKGGPKLPTLEELVSPNRNADLAAAKTSAYDAVDNSGARYSNQAYNGLVNDIVAKATADNLNPQIHGAATSFIDQMRNAPEGFSPTLTQLDQLRQQASRDLFGDKPNAHFGKMIIGAIDDAINNAGQGSMVTGSGPASADLINTARAANTTLSKTNEFDDAIQRALANAGASGSGGNVNNTLRQQMKPFINDQSVKRGYTPDQIDQMRQVIEGTPVQNGLRLVGKLSPSGNGLMAALNLGAALFTHGMSTAIPVAGAIAKHAADGMTESRVAKLRENIAGRPAPANAPAFTDKQQRDMIAAIMGSFQGQQQ